MKKFKVCAILSFFNEGDILDEVLHSLVSNDIDVYLIDNGSTDDSSQVASKYFDRGVIGLERLVFHDQSGREIFNWGEILKAKERLAKLLPYDWFIHADADEVRLGPWPDSNLRESIMRVDGEGYELINFKVFNLRPVAELDAKMAITSQMLYYNLGLPVDSQQLKCWKASINLDLQAFGGHRAGRVGRVYPIRFLLKHYPLRSETQIKRKLLVERFGRYSESERSKGWHNQYDSFLQNGIKTVWSERETVPFNLETERAKLIHESTEVLVKAWSFAKRYDYDPILEGISNELYIIFQKGDMSEQQCHELVNYLSTCLMSLHNGKSFSIAIEDKKSVALFRMAVDYVAAQFYLCGRPRLWDSRVLMLNGPNELDQSCASGSWER